MGEEGPARGLSGSTVGHYRIESLIGKGGMGEVYLASDLKLRRKVAIKALPESLAEEASARARFLRECRLACKVVHPYVATVFDVIEHAERPLIVMERIEGSRLDQWVRATSPKPESLAALGLEIAEALAAIHRAGIVHRDLKPGNVMVTPDGHVKVTDFGVSLPVPGLPDDLSTVAAEDADPVTRTGMGVGTVAYMSPEQIRGERLDGRSDLFSLGIVLYEAVTGEHPFRRESLLGTASAILHDPPSGGREHPTLTGSGPFRDVILRLLQKSPALRYGSAEDLATDLRAVLRGEGISPRPRPAIPWTRIAAAALAVVVVGAVGWWLATRDGNGGGGGTTVPRPVIAVLPFEDETGDVEGPARAAMVANLLGAVLHESGDLRPVGEERLGTALASMPRVRAASDADRIGQRTGAEWIVGGRIYADGSAWQAAVDLVHVGEPQRTESFRVSAARPFGLVDAAAAGVLSRTRAEPAPPPGELRETGWASGDERAQLLVDRARRAARELRYTEAAQLLEAALGIDPDFALAHARLAEVLDLSGYGTRARRAADESIRLAAAQSRPVSRAVHVEIEGITAKVRDDGTEELNARRTLASTSPDDPDALLALANALRRRGALDEAEGIVTRVSALDPGDPRIPLTRARLLAAQGRYEAASEAIESARQAFAAFGSPSGEAEAVWGRAMIRFQNGDYGGAAEDYGSAARAFRDLGLGAMATMCEAGTGDCALAAGRLTDAESIYRTTIRDGRSHGHYRTTVSALGKLGAVFAAAGKTDAAIRDLREAVADAEAVDNAALALSPRANLASALMYGGRVAESRSTAERVLTDARRQRHVAAEGLALTVLADLANQEGRFEESATRGGEVVRLHEVRGDAGRRDLATALLARTSALSITGRLGEALESVDRCVRIRRDLGEDTGLAAALIRRARVRVELADTAGASADLEEAGKLLPKSGTALPGSRCRLDLARGQLERAAGRRPEARTTLLEARTQAQAAATVEIEALALVELCALEVEEGRFEDAEARARAALAAPGANAISSLPASECLGRALAGTKDREGAVKELTLSLERAETAGYPLVGARAAAALVALRPGSGVTEFVGRGRRQWDRYVAGVPEARRTAVLGRSDLRETRTLFEDLPAEGRIEEGARL